MLFTEYETFKMKDGKTLQDMITRLITLMNKLSSLGMELTTQEKEEKVLRILSKANQDVKITTIRKANNINTITLMNWQGT